MKQRIRITAEGHPCFGQEGFIPLDEKGLVQTDSFFGFAQAQLDNGAKCMVLGDQVEFVGEIVAK